MPKTLLLGIAFVNFQVVLLALVWFMAGDVAEDVYRDFNFERLSGGVPMVLIAMSVATVVASFQVPVMLGRDRFVSQVIGLVLAEFAGLVGFVLGFAFGELYMGSALIGLAIICLAMQIVLQRNHFNPRAQSQTPGH